MKADTPLLSCEFEFVADDAILAQLCGDWVGLAPLGA